MQDSNKVDTLSEIIEKEAPPLHNFFKELPKMRHSYVDYNSLVYSIFRKDPELEETILHEVNEGIFDKRSDGGFKLYNRLSLNISNKEIRQKNNIKNRRFKKGHNINNYLKNSFKTNVNKYLKKYSK